MHLSPKTVIWMNCTVFCKIIECVLLFLPAVSLILGKTKGTEAYENS